MTHGANQLSPSSLFARGRGGLISDPFERKEKITGDEKKIKALLLPSLFAPKASIIAVARRETTSPEPTFVHATTAAATIVLGPVSSPKI